MYIRVWGGVKYIFLEKRRVFYLSTWGGGQRPSQACLGGGHSWPKFFVMWHSHLRERGGWFVDPSPSKREKEIRAHLKKG